MAEPSPPTAEELNMECFRISGQLDDLPWLVDPALRLTRHLLRIAGRLLIDAASADASPTAWPNTETQVLQWLREALRPLGYDVRPLPGSGREEVPDPSADW